MTGTKVLAPAATEGAGAHEQVAAPGGAGAPEKARLRSGRLVLPGWLAPAAAGVFAGTALFDLLPAAAAAGGGTAGWAAAGLATMAAITSLSARNGRRWVSYLAMAGVWMHSILEGLVAAAGFAAPSALGSKAGLAAGLLVSLGLVSHLIPESLALFGLLNGCGARFRRAVTGSVAPWLLVIAGFATGQLWLDGRPAPVLGAAIAFGGGAFLWLARLSWGRRTATASRSAAASLIGMLWIAALHLV
ncbi:MAG: hypothetical protein ACT4OM_01440 [Actinomycetota bacterium]